MVGINKTVERLFEVMKLKSSRIRKNQIYLHEQLENELQKAKHLLIVKETELKAVIAQADVMAHTDELTYLPNRRQILGDLQREVIFSNHYNTPLSIAILDIDHLEKINNSYGHMVGDEVLMGFASILREPVRYPDTVGRYGGDEFLLVLPHSSLNAAREFVERLHQHIRSNPITCDEITFDLSISSGIAEYNAQREDWKSLLLRADKALYQTKNIRRY